MKKEYVRTDYLYELPVVGYKSPTLGNMNPTMYCVRDSQITVFCLDNAGALNRESYKKWNAAAHDVTVSSGAVTIKAYAVKQGTDNPLAWLLGKMTVMLVP